MSKVTQHVGQGVNCPPAPPWELGGGRDPVFLVTVWETGIGLVCGGCSPHCSRWFSERGAG